MLSRSVETVRGLREFLLSMANRNSICRVVALFLDEGRCGFREGIEILKPIVQERMDKLRDLGEDWPDKPVRAVNTSRVRNISKTEAGRYDPMDH